MNRPGQSVILFCDDVRLEAGGKVSYMGVLGPEVWVTPYKPFDVYCVLLLWAFEPHVTISAEFDFENAPEGIEPADPFRREMRQDEDDDADRWLIQLSGRLKLRVDEGPLIVSAKFVVGDQTYTNRVIFEARPSEPDAEGAGIARAEETASVAGN